MDADNENYKEYRETFEGKRFIKELENLEDRWKNVILERDNTPEKTNAFFRDRFSESFTDLPPEVRRWIFRDHIAAQEALDGVVAEHGYPSDRNAAWSLEAQMAATTVLVESFPAYTGKHLEGILTSASKGDFDKEDTARILDQVLFNTGQSRLFVTFPLTGLHNKPILMWNVKELTERLRNIGHQYLEAELMVEMSLKVGMIIPTEGPMPHYNGITWDGRDIIRITPENHPNTSPSKFKIPARHAFDLANFEMSPGGVAIPKGSL
jgi:hypothetical protein